MKNPTVTERTIQHLRAAAKALTSVAFMPGLSLRLFDVAIWNNNMDIVLGTGGKHSQAKIRADRANLHRATHVVGRMPFGGFLFAYLEIEGLPKIPLLHIGEPALVTQSGCRAKIMEVIAPLPPELRLKIYKMLARYLLNQRRQKREKKEGLLRQLRDLER